MVPVTTSDFSSMTRDLRVNVKPNLTSFLLLEKLRIIFALKELFDYGNVSNVPNVSLSVYL